MAYDWFRCDAGFPDHPKTRLLVTTMKDRKASWYLTNMWCWVQKYCPEGTLSLATALAVERQWGWCGKAGTLVRLLCDTGWLDEEYPGVLSVHNWGLRQGALVEKSKKDAELKRTKREESKARGAETARAAHAPGARAAASTLRDETRRDETRRKTTTEDLVERTAFDGSVAIQQQPTDRPQPSLKLVNDIVAHAAADAHAVALEPTPEVDSTVEVPAAKPKKPTTATWHEDERDVFEHWRVGCNHPEAVPTTARRKLIAKWLRLYSVERLQAAIDGCARSPFHQGQNDRNKRYDSLELILRDAQHIEDFESQASR